MEIDVAKSICIASLFLSSFLFGCAPYFIVLRKDSNPSAAGVRELVISYLKCFGGGVFMGTSLIYLLPNGMRSMDKYFAMVGIETEFPAYMAITALGFFIIAFIELFAHSLLHKHGSHTHQNTGHHAADNTTHACNGAALAGIKGEMKSDSMDVVIPSSYNRVASSINGRSETHEMKEVYQVRHSENTPSEQSSHNGVATHQQDAEGGHDEVGDIMSAIVGNSLPTFLLLAALCFHTIFDGMAVGLGTTLKDVWQIFMAIIIHKSLVAISLGLQLFLAFKEKPMKAVLWTFIFSAIAPIGIAIGMGVTSGDLDTEAKQLTNTFLQGLATGTFLYVTFFEMLKEELVDKKEFYRLCIVIVGFVSMGLVRYLSHL